MLYDDKMREIGFYSDKLSIDRDRQTQKLSTVFWRKREICAEADQTPHKKGVKREIIWK